MLQPFSSEMQSHLSRDSVRLAYFVELDLNPQALIHSGVGEITHKGKTYVGVGNLGSVDSVRQSGEMESNAVRLSLSGLDNGLLDLALTGKFILKNCRIYLGALDEDNKTVLAMDLLFSGFVANVNVNAGESNYIELSINNKMDKWRGGKPDRFSDESHLARHAGDNFFQYLAKTSTMDVRWGNTATQERFRYR